MIVQAGPRPPETGAIAFPGALTRHRPDVDPAVLALGFRIFFLGAGAFAVLTMIQWAGVYGLGWQVPLARVSMFQWHAHEMIYGYAMAVIAGFLLTAARNWTGMQTLAGRGLLGLFLLWGLARALLVFGTAFLSWAALAQALFMTVLWVAVAVPVFRSRQWRQTAILGKLLLLGACDLLFHLGASGLIEHGVRWGIYGGLYLLIALVLTMGRRVIPFFIERGVGYPVTLHNARWIDVSSLLLFLAFFVVEVFLRLPETGAALAALLFLVTTARLVGWHTHGIWNRPLLWSLYLSLGFIDVGFLLHALTPVAGLSPFIAIHAFTVGGIGLVTLSMMARVSLGHTGRNINSPPQGVAAALGLLAGSALARISGPLFDAAHYPAWILASQTLWIAAFAVFLAVFTPVLTRPRPDGRQG
ncbi:MAG TPA: NnrS family protein [Gammaproteobacteria bacterium]